MADGLGFVSRMELARNAILAQIEERDRCFPQYAPVAPWACALKAMSYVLRMPADDLRSVRLHCDWFLGENTPVQLWLKESGFDRALAWLGEGVDPALWAREPVVPALGRPLGHASDVGHVNLTTIAVQRYLCNLLRLGLSDGQDVVEIGAGYGGLAHEILRARNVRYAIIDLPETLIFAASFLIHHFPDKRVYVYRPGDVPQMMVGADIVLLPNYRADWMPRCHFAINTVSFPEMSREALTEYLDLIADRLAPGGMLMSVNYDYRSERLDGLGVYDFLTERFDIFPGKQAVLEASGKSEADWRDLNFRPTMVCTRRGEHPPQATMRDILGWDILVIPLHARTVPTNPVCTLVGDPPSPL